MNDFNNIKEICSAGLCSGCGACTVACPQACISLEERDFNRPVVNEESCTKCKLCLKICPSYDRDIFLISKPSIECSDYLGSLNQCVVCHATDREVRLKAASGGFITTMAAYLIEHKLVDGVVCVKQNSDNPLANEVIIARNIQEMHSTTASRYSAASNCQPLKSLLTDTGKYAFIGKPCDIQGLRNLQSLFPQLRKNIYLTMGLFCHHTPSRTALYEILRIHKVNENEVVSIKFRGNGWPGYFEVKCEDGQIIRTPYFEAWNQYFSKKEYVQLRCFTCTDAFAAGADFSVGDPWGAEYRDEELGCSSVIIRSEHAQKHYQELLASGLISGKTVEVADIIRHQKNLLLKCGNARIWKEAVVLSRMGVMGALKRIFQQDAAVRMKLSMLKKIIEVKKKVGKV